MAETPWHPVALAEADWLAELDPDGADRGFDPGSRPDAVWILHAMYEWESGPTRTTHQDLRRSLLEAGMVEPNVVGGIDVDAWGVIETGGQVGRSQHPGQGWRRLRWHELAQRLGEPVVAEGEQPCFRSLAGAHPDGSWPASVEPPAEGSLDREGWSRLVELLLQWAPMGAATPCLAYLSPGHSPDDQARVLAGPLGAAAALYDHDFGDGSPANLWPVDRAWVTWSDWDLWGTKVSGPSDLVEAVLADSGLEAVRLPWC
ncbi:hypothetical protein [Catellatospora sp. TT07R-123]|uniref:hypothetical protein n=1 Tax=Catellatospora sp. TT07R-123 TaxID=2733863 RepID=UPI001BB44400|nr:hypothetical protein [Catellatospora sp. TT07R-123]